MTPQITMITGDDIPTPNGHYVQATAANGFIFTSVQLGLTGMEAETVSIHDQFTTAAEKIKAILKSAGSELDKVVKVTIYLADIKYWDEINTIYSQVFGAHKPARGIIPVSRLHLGAQVALDVIALA